MRTARWILTGALCCATAGAWALPAIRTSFIKNAKIKPTSPLAQAQCALCHVANGTARNPFGRDLGAAMKAARTREVSAAVLKKISTLDSDKDGATNAKELAANTLPGDPKSKPKK